MCRGGSVNPSSLVSTWKLRIWSSKKEPPTGLSVARTDSPLYIKEIDILMQRINDRFKCLEGEIRMSEPHLTDEVHTLQNRMQELMLRLIKKASVLVRLNFTHKRINK